MSRRSVLIAFAAAIVLATRVPGQVVASATRLAPVSVRGEPGRELGAGKFRVAVGLPIIYDETTILVAGIGWEPLLLDGSAREVALPAEIPGTVHLLRAEGIFVRKIAATWRIIAVARPGVQTDFRDVGRDDVGFLGVLELNRTISPAFSLGPGVYYSSDLGHGAAYPTLRMKFDGPGAVDVDAFLPFSLDVTYGISPRVLAGAGFSIDGAWYRIGENGDRFLRYRYATAGPVAKWRIAPRLVVEVRGGASFYRAAGVHDASGEVRPLTPGTGAFLSAALTYGS